MEQEKEKGFLPIYILAACYVASVYLFPVIPYWGSKINTNKGYDFGGWLLVLPLILDIISLIVVIFGKNLIGRTRFLNCAILIKYSLIPLFMIGGFCVVAALLLTFTPVVIMIFAGPMMAVTLSVLGWIVMLGSVSYSLAYIIKSYKQGIHGKAISVIAGIFQFFFAVDVISIMVLSLKEKKCVKVTIAIIVLLILAVLVAGIGLIWAIAKAVLA
ncbi:MAG: hypothetical protein ACI39N_00980 [Lachnospiraceae bacterium]